MSLNIVFVLSSGNKVEDAIALHHESNHGYTQKTAVIFSRGEERAGSYGFVTTRRKRSRGGDASEKDRQRGCVLEEGMATYDSIRYINGEFSVEFPEEYAHYVAGLRGKYPDILASDSELVKYHLKKNFYSEGYNLSAEIIEYLIKGVAENHVRGKYFDKFFHQTHARPRQTRRLMDMVDSVYGAGTTKRLYKASTDDLEELRSILEFLKQKTQA